MGGNHNRTLSGLRNTRDLRAEILDLAKDLVGNRDIGFLRVVEPVISAKTVQKEWDSAIEVLSPSIQARLHLQFVAPVPCPDRSLSWVVNQGIFPLERPNYRFEVLRQLIGSSLENDGLQPVRRLADWIGASQPTIRSALTELEKAGLCRRWGARHELVAEDVTVRGMARIKALPQTLRFRYAQGTMPLPPAELASRAMLLLGPDAPPSWAPFALSGTPAALAEVSEVDLMGTPRLDLVAHVSRQAKAINMREALHLLNDGLELEPSPLASAPVVVTVGRADKRLDQLGVIDKVRCAMPGDVYLSLIDANLREQAYQYAAGVRP